MHEVGDIIYLLSRKNHKIVPARVESVTTIKKINETDVTHELSIPGAEPTQLIVLEKLDVDVFQDVQSLKGHMLKIVQQKVNNDISVVNELVMAAWPSVRLERPDNKMSMPDFVEDKKKESAVVKVQLPDGSMANVQMPRELM
jgi:hypothetical protein